MLAPTECATHDICAQTGPELFYAVSTLADPRHRGKLFLPDQLTTVIGMLAEKASRVQLQPTSPSSDVASEATKLQTGTEQPAAKRDIWKSLY